MRSVSPKQTSSPRHKIAAFGGLFAALIVILFLVDLRWRYYAAIQGAEQSAINYAQVLAEHTARSFETVDRSLRQVELIRSNVMTGSGETNSNQPGTTQGANEALHRLQQTSPFLVMIGWTDAAGDLVVHSDNEATSRTNLSDLPPLIARRDPEGDKLFVGSPFYSAASGRWLIAASRRLNNLDGSFAGIAVAVLDPGYFAGIYRSLRLGTNGSVLVMTRSGEFLLREPTDSTDHGRSYASGVMLTKHLPLAETGTYEFVGRTDGVARIAGYKAVPGLPLVIIVTHSRADVLAPWYRHLFTFGPLAAVVVAVILLGTGLLARQTRDLARKTDILEVTLENMAHGLCMFDGAQRMTVCNARFAAMYGLTEEHIKPGTSFRSMLEAWLPDIGDPEAAREAIERRIERAQGQEPYYVVNQLRDGRVIGVTHQPIAGGGWVDIHQDVTDRRRDEAKVAYMAHHDLLTGVANRTYFMEKLEDAAARLCRRQQPFGIFMLDLDKFKSVNDSLGHPAGDALLKEAARRLKTALRTTDTLARLGGDEFAIILSGDADPREAAVPIANRIIDLITEPYNIDGNIVNIGTSIGIALAPTNGVDPETLMKKADLALYRTKSEGRNDYCFFDDGMAADAEARHQLEIELRAAIAHDELEVHYQPIVDVATEKLFGVEALVRWHHPTRGYIPPSEFIPIAEETGLIASLGEWVLQTACADAMHWPANIKVAVNTSPLQFSTSNLLDIILCALSESGLPPERLELEITESTLLENESTHLAILRQLKNLGVSISLDDFGTGYSSLSYLTIFPFDKIKIGKSFTQNLTHRVDCAAIVSSVLALGAGLDLPTVAEGVETRQQFEILRASGVKFVQGYLFGRPCRASEIDFDLGPSCRQRIENVA